MQDDFIRALRGRRGEIRARWEALLRIERVNTPLANPDALVFMIDWTCDEIFAALSHGAARKRPARGADARNRAECPCGRNPLLIYFAAGEQALEEALILEQASRPGLDPALRDAEFDELQLTLREISRREIESFCAVCQYRAAETSIVADGSPAALATDQPLPGPCNRSR